MLQNRFKSSFRETINFEDWTAFKSNKSQRGGNVSHINTNELHVAFVDYTENKKKLAAGIKIERIRCDIYIGKDICNQLGIIAGSRCRLLHHPEDILQLLLAPSDNGEYKARKVSYTDKYLIVSFPWEISWFAIRHRERRQVVYEIFDRKNLVFQIKDN